MSVIGTFLIAYVFTRVNVKLEETFDENYADIESDIAIQLINDVLQEVS